MGRPAPKVTWVKVQSASHVIKVESGATLVSLSANFDLKSVRVKDSGKYTCTATNGLEPNASASLVLYVREAATVPPKRMSGDLKPAEEVSSGGGNSSSGAIAGGVIAVLAVVALVVVLVFFILRHRRKEERFLDRLSAQRSIDDSEGQGTYATCSSLPRQSLDQLPPYLELLPPTGSDLKLTNVSNPGYGSNDMIIGQKSPVSKNQSANSNRPLPSTPLEHCDTEYDYIDESHVLSSSGPHAIENAYLKLQAVRTVSDGASCAADADGYEIPVKPREPRENKSSPEGKQPTPASRQRVPVRAQTVHTTTPGARADVGSKGKHQTGRNQPSTSRPVAAARSSSSQAINRRGSQDFCLNDFNYDTSF
ncbi:hypothetical protein ElyMa_006257700 [Elysia marginata]|uniref:Ig-like domain-containing protein n=1 Tax=Elysia marginata TaxID=1093978 RepID=A0AAV4HCJ8_9GAST|nr:hypothetical protein ElyMa_006257700 [Elysia marginata]